MLSDEQIMDIQRRVMQTASLAGVKEFEDDLALLLIELKRGRAAELQNRDLLEALKVAHEALTGKRAIDPDGIKLVIETSESHSPKDQSTAPPSMMNPTPIVVNGEEVVVDAEFLEFAVVVRLAKGRPTDTVTYAKALAPKPCGIMAEGDRVDIQRGTIFNVVDTSKA